MFLHPRLRLQRLYRAFRSSFRPVGETSTATPHERVQICPACQELLHPQSSSTSEVQICPNCGRPIRTDNDVTHNVLA